MARYGRQAALRSVVVRRATARPSYRRSAGLQACLAQQTQNPLAPAHQGQRAGRCAHARPRDRRHRRAAARKPDARRSRRHTSRSVGAAALDGAAGRRHRHRPDRQERHSRSRDAARAPVLLDRPRRLRTARRQLLASLSRRRRDDDAHGRKHQRDHGHQSEPPDCRRRDAWPGHRRDRAIRQRPEPVPPDARAQEAPTRRGGTSRTGPIRARRR